MKNKKTEVMERIELKESGLTKLTVTLDGKGFIKETVGEGVKPFIARVTPDGKRTKAKLPAGKYELVIDKDGYIVQMSPALRISCESHPQQYCTNVWIGTGWHCVP